VVGDVATGGAHQVDPHLLANAHALPNVEVPNGPQILLDLGLKPGFLGDLAQRGFLGRLLAFDETFRKAPRQIATSGSSGG
jgi:hypothetical protein